MSYPPCYAARMNFKVFESNPLRKQHAPASVRRPLVPSITFRPYQKDAFENRTHGLECWCWGRQTGKSFTLAAWAVDRLLTRPGRLVTILSNSLANGIELNLKCAELARHFNAAYEQSGDTASFDTLNCETRIHTQGQTGRIKVLPANPRTARGFSGDLILDEFAFHENSQAIWEAAEPILAANKDYLCRIASTPNGRHNIFYRLVQPSLENEGAMYASAALSPADEVGAASFLSSGERARVRAAFNSNSKISIPVRFIPRSVAWQQGMPIYHPVTREPITPNQARALAPDKRAYDQNYECQFESENMPLLSHELITAPEQPNVGIICDHDWSPESLHFLKMPNEKCSMLNEKWKSDSPLFVGVDVGRSRNLTVITVLEKSVGSLVVRAILRLANMRLPDQQSRLETICSLPGFCGANIDRTGLGLGLYEYTRAKLGDRIEGIDFATTITSASHQIRLPAGASRVRVPEALALQLLRAFEDRSIHIPAQDELREDLRKPERITTPSGEVRIAATSDQAGHADHFWSLALAINAAQCLRPVHIEVVQITRPPSIPRKYLI
jgi:phage FluMu gp28-like protein